MCHQEECSSGYRGRIAHQYTEFISLGYIINGGVPGLYVGSAFHFFEELSTMLGVCKTLHFYKCVPRVQLPMSLPALKALVCETTSLLPGNNRLVQCLLIPEEELSSMIVPFAARNFEFERIPCLAMFAFVDWYFC